MRISIEACLTVNFLVDFAIFSIVARSMQRFRLRRVFAAAFLGAGYAVLWLCTPVLRRFFPVHAVILYWLSSLIVGSLDFRVCATIAMMLFIGGLICGGSGMLLRASGVQFSTSVGIAFGALAFQFLLFFRRQRQNDWNADIIIDSHGQSVRLTALIDTGNRLHDPITGLPVLIVEKQLIEKILPVRHMHRIPYGALGGNGTLDCFLPDRVRIIIKNQVYPAPDVWVAVSDTPLPGINRALAPCEFASLPHR